MSIKSFVGRMLLGKEFIQSSVMNKLDIFGSWKGETDQQELVKKIKGWSYTCVNRNSNVAAQVPIKLYLIKKESEQPTKQNYKSKPIAEAKQMHFLKSKLLEKISEGYTLQEVTEHPILDLLRNVNPQQNAFELKYQTVASLEITGNAFWYLHSGTLGVVYEIYPLFAQHMKIIPDEELGIKEYEYGVGTNKKKFRPDQIVHFRYPSMTDPFLGTGPTQAACQPIDLMDYYNRYEIACLKNGGMPSVVMTMGENAFMTPEEKRRVEAKWRANYSGPDKQGKLMIGSPGVDIKEVGFSPKEMSYTKGRETSLEEICGAYGVPMSFVKVQEVSRANAWASFYIYAQYTINPKLILIEQKLNEVFTPHWDKNLVLLFDDATPVDRDYRLLEKRTNLETKYSSINEERENDGLEPVEWGKEPEKPAAPFSMGSFGGSSDGPAKPDKPDDEDQGKSLKKAAPEEGPKTELPKPDFMPVVMLTQLTLFFKSMISEVTRNLKKTELKSYHGKALPNDLMAAAFDNKKLQEKLAADLMPFMKAILTHATIESMEKLNPNAFYNASSPSVMQALERRSGQIKSIIETSESQIRRLVTAGIEDGLSTSQIVKSIKDGFDSRAAAQRVVRTETIWAHNEGVQQGWIQSKVVTAKQWDTAPDERRCPYCASMHGKRISLTESYFKQGETLSVGPDEQLTFDYENVDHPPLHPGCRCQIIPILVTEEQSEIAVSPGAAARNINNALNQ